MLRRLRGRRGSIVGLGCEAARSDDVWKREVAAHDEQPALLAKVARGAAVLTASIVMIKVREEGKEKGLRGRRRALSRSETEKRLDPSQRRQSADERERDRARQYAHEAA